MSQIIETKFNYSKVEKSFNNSIVELEQINADIKKLGNANIAIIGKNGELTIEPFYYKSESLSSITDNLKEKMIYLAVPSMRHFIQRFTSFISKIMDVMTRIRNIKVLKMVSQDEKVKLDSDNSFSNEMYECLNNEFAVALKRLSNQKVIPEIIETKFNYSKVEKSFNNSIVELEQINADIKKLGNANIVIIDKNGDLTFVPFYYKSESLSSITDNLKEKMIYLAVPSMRHFIQRFTSFISKIMDVMTRIRNIKVLKMVLQDEKDKLDSDNSFSNEMYECLNNEFVWTLKRLSNQEVISEIVEELSGNMFNIIPKGSKSSFLYQSDISETRIFHFHNNVVKAIVLNLIEKYGKESLKYFMDKYENMLVELFEIASAIYLKLSNGNNIMLNDELDAVKLKIDNWTNCYRQISKNSEIKLYSL